MSSLTGSSISSTYDRLLALPAGGGDTTNLVALTDGDGSTTFALKLSTNKADIQGELTVGVDGTGFDVKFFGDTATNGYMLWDQNTDDLILGSASKLGIGITSPAYPLDIQTSGEAKMRISSTDNAATLRINSNVSSGDHSSYLYFSKGADDVRGMIKFDHNSTAADETMQFWTGDNGQQNMSMLGDGSVGINKSASPLAQLHVVGRDASSEPVLRLEQLDIDMPYLRFEGTTAADATRSTSTATTTSASIVRQVMVHYDGGSTGWIRIYDGVA